MSFIPGDVSAKEEIRLTLSALGGALKGMSKSLDTFEQKLHAAADRAGEDEKEGPVKLLLERELPMAQKDLEYLHELVQKALKD